jgi:RNA polymerase sigma-70 factor, ECF subfamily
LCAGDCNVRRGPAMKRSVIKESTAVERRARFEAIFEETYERLLAYARRRVGAEADDVVAETLTITWRRLQDVPDDPLPWLYGVARKVISDQRRAGRRRHALVDRLCAHAETRAPGGRTSPGPVLFAALARLSDPDREAILLVAWEELSAQQAATAMGCSIVAFRVRLHRARKRLRRHLGELDCGQERFPGASPVVKEVETA